jgi:hypothetical protein
VNKRSTTWGAAAGLVALALLPAAVCEAGIVVLKRGDVIVGKVKADQPRGGVVHMTWPYGSRLGSGHMEFKEEEVRWCDPTSDVLGDAYFERHLEDNLRGAVWMRMREEYLIRKCPTQVGTDVGIPVPTPKISLDPLDVNALPGEGFTIRKPRGWGSRVLSKEQILILEAPVNSSRGFRPRVHAFAVQGVTHTPKEQVDWIEGELRELRSATRGLAGFRLLGPVRLKTLKAGSAEAHLRTETKLEKRNIVAVRRIAFRSGRTVVVAGYVDERDLPAFESLLEACLESMTVLTD